METKKKYIIGDIVEIEELEKVATVIVLKGLKVIETSGNAWATRIIEKKDVESFEDLKQIVILEILENDYKITKKCYKKINQYLYNLKVDKIKNIEIVIDEETNTSSLDKKSYIDYIKKENSFYKEEKKHKKISLENLNLTKKQLEILNIYSKIGSLAKTAEILNLSKSTVQVTIERIRKKAVAMIKSFEY